MPKAGFDLSVYDAGHYSQGDNAKYSCVRRGIRVSLCLQCRSNAITSSFLETRKVCSEEAMGLDTVQVRGHAL